MKAIEQELTNAGIRKAAILVACLDRAAADAVLEHLSPELAQRVRQAVVVLDDVPDGEQHLIMDEFFRLGPESSTHGQPQGVELGGRLAREINLGRSSPSIRETTKKNPPAKPFVGLREAEEEKIARLLSGERPQTIALVLSHLSSRQAGGVLSLLQPELQTEVVRRLVDLEETDATVLHEVEQALEKRLSQRLPMQRRRVAGLQAVEGILQAAESGVRMQIIDNLTERDRALADKLGPPAVEFDDLPNLDDDTFYELIRCADPQWLMPALLGASPEITERALDSMPQNQAESLRRALEQPGPIRLSDVETARQKIAETAARVMFAKGNAALYAE
jgi:flagellar motor switch protein FliG